MKMVRKMLVAISATLVGAAVPALALAGNPSATPGNGGQTEGQVASGVLDTSSGALPFTGLNLALIVFAGLGLLAFGLVLRRRGDATK